MKQDKDMGNLDNDLTLLDEAVREAGALALKYFKRSINMKTKADRTPVTEADLAVDKFLNERLAGPRPEYGWLSEESVDNANRLNTRRVWVVDPIDGTRSFIAGKSDWVISAGLVEDGEPVLGALYNAVTKELFLARKGAGAWINGAAMRASSKDALPGARMIVTKGFFKQKIWSSPWPEADIIWANSIAYRLALIASGRADATMALSGKSEWDLAAAALLVQEAGGIITDAKGRRLRFNQPVPRINGLVAATSGLHAQLIARTSPVAAERI